MAVALIISSLPSAAASYKIKQGDSLWTIASKHHTTVTKLLKANHIRETSVLALGKDLTIPGKASDKRQQKNRINTTKPIRTARYDVHVKATNAFLRSAPKSAAHRVAMLSTGTTLKLISRDGKWAKVALPGGVRGFVYRPLLAGGAGAHKSTRQVASSHSNAPSQPDRHDHSLIQTALACRGAHYQRGGTSRGGFDCSGFTRYVYAKYGIPLPHSSAAQAGRGMSVSRGELQSGDLVFFQTNRRGISHVGIYIGSGNFVHAESRGEGVTVDSLNSRYYGPRYRGARRIR